MYDNSSRSYFWAKLAAVLAVAILIFGIIGYFAFSTKVSANEACIKTKNGAIQGVLDSGRHFINPITTKTVCYTSLRQTYEVSLVDPKDSDSQADYIDYSVKSRSKEGVNFDTAYVIQYHIDRESVLNLYQNGAKSQERVNENIVKFHSRAIVPQTLSNYSAEQLYTGSLLEISAEIFPILQERFSQQGVVLDYFELKRGDFDDTYEQAISDKAIKVEQTAQKKLEQQYASAEAERVRIEAEGQAAQKRIQAQADADAAKIAADAEAYAITTRAQAQADAETVVLEQRAAVVNANPVLVEWHRIDTIMSANVIYLPDDILPILPMSPNTGPTP